MELLVEKFEDIITESILEEATNSKKWYIEGVTIQTEVVNGNKRKYLKEPTRKAIEEHRINVMEKNRSGAELGHPEKNSHELNMENICAKFISIKEDGNNFITKARVCSELPKGKVLEGLLSEGFNLGISSRMLGTTKKDKDCTLVTECQIISFGDIVVTPSGPDCWLSALQENKEWVFLNGTYVQKDLSESIENYKTLIKEAKAKDVQKVLRNIFKDYINKLSS